MDPRTSRSSCGSLLNHAAAGLASTSHLAHWPTSDIRAHSSGVSGRKHVWGALQEQDPFAGLSEKRPVRMLAALAHHLREAGPHITEAWTRFLYDDARRTEKPKIAFLIAKRLTALPEAVLQVIISPASHWLETVHARLFAIDAPTLYGRSINSQEFSPGIPRRWMEAPAGGETTRLDQRGLRICEWKPRARVVR